MSIFIVAEIGINHNGSVGRAKQLIDVAVDCGADAVKFQKRTVEVAYDTEFLNGPRESPWGMTQRAQKEGLELSEADYRQIDDHCKRSGVEWFASAWDVASYDLLRRFDPSYNKIASAMVAQTELLEAVAADGKLTFISTGKSTLDALDHAVEVFRAAGCPFELMHCVSAYPMPDEDANLMAIPALRARYECDVGYSGHEVGIAVSLEAAALGISSIERHITLDRAMYGSDQAASVEPDELRALVAGVRRIEAGRPGCGLPASPMLLDTAP